MDFLLCRLLTDSDRCETPDSDICFPTRSASGMVKDLIGNVGAGPGPLTMSPVFESPSTPPTPGSAKSEKEYLLEESEEGAGAESKSVSASRQRRGMKKKAVSIGHTPIRKELYNIQDSLINLEWESLNDETHSLTSDDPPSTRSENVERKSMSPDLELLSRSVGAAEGLKDGFLTMQPASSRRKWQNWTLKRKSLMPTMLKSIDITPPSPVNNPAAFVGQISRRVRRGRKVQGEEGTGEGAGEGKGWKRKTAIRRKRRTGSTSESPSIPETSYSFQVQ